jgi:hypothetical protein
LFLKRHYDIAIVFFDQFTNCVHKLCCARLGANGTPVIGLVAEQHLTQQTQAAVYDLLEGESLAFVSTFGDEIRSIRDYDHLKLWHYVNMPLDKRYR